MRKSLSSFILVFFIFSASIFGQSELSGYVSSKNDSKKIANVNVLIPVLNLGTVTNSEGYYEFKNLPAGYYQVQFSYVGYKSVINNINLVDGGNKLNVELLPTNIEMGQVVVLGNSVNEIEKAPYKVERISVGDLNSNGFITLKNSLALLLGISELSNGFAISKPVIRGMYGYRTAAIVGGLRFDNQEWQNEHGFGVSDVGVSSLEVVEGPAALLFGANVIGGAVIFVDPAFAPSGETVGNADLQIFSNTLGANARVGLKGSGENLRWQLYLGGESHADYLAGGGQKIPNTRFAGFSAKGILNFSYASGFSTLDYSFAHNLYGVVEANGLNNPKDLAEDHFERGFEGPHHIVDYHIISLKNLFLSGNSKFKVNFGFQNNHRVEQEGTEDVAAAGDMGELDVILNTFSYDAEWIYPVMENAELTVGTQGQIQKNENDGGRILVPNADMNEFSGFTYLKKNFSKFILEGGVRYDINKITTEETGMKDSAGYMKALDLIFNTFNGAIGGSYSLDNNWIFKLNFATGFRAPNLAELSSNGVHEGTTRYEIGNPAMESEQNYQADFGITYSNENVKFSVSAFNNKVNNYIYLEAQNRFIGLYDVYMFRQQDATLNGGEASLDVKTSGLYDMNISYSTVTGKKADGGYLPFMPADKIIFNNIFSFADVGAFQNNKFNLRFRGYLAQNRNATNETPTPGYVLLDAGISTSVKFFGRPFDLVLNGTNLLDKVYINHLSLLKPLGVPDIGRNISFSVNTTF